MTVNSTRMYRGRLIQTEQSAHSPQQVKSGAVYRGISTQVRSLRNIVFVDDERDILKGLKRMLRSHRKEWNMSFFEHAKDAMDHLDRHDVDVIVSDMRMPGIDGAKLLCWVRENHPGVIRMALSGYADSELILESIHVTHQFIPKPAEPGQIEDTLNRTMRVLERLGNEELLSQLNGLESLPTLPKIYDQLMQLLATDDCDMEDIGNIIEQDMSLSASLMRIANSAFFGYFGHIESPSHAALRLGSDTLKNLVLSEKVFQDFSGEDFDTQKIASLNNKASRWGALANQFASAARIEHRTSDHCQIAGMMSQVGELACSTVLRDLDTIKSGKLEEHVIGAHILNLWGLPQAISEAILFYREPELVETETILPVHVLFAIWKLEECSIQEAREEIRKFANADITEHWITTHIALVEAINERE